jgi:hypothetical protein
MGAYWLGMALLQSWPGRGFWQGQPTPRSTAGQLVSMVRQMATTPQPDVLSSWLRAFASFDAAHGWGVNLFVVVALAATGALFLSGRQRSALVGVLMGLPLCAATWVLVQDLGFLGGEGTDLNSMIPNAILFVGGHLAMVKVPAPAQAPVQAQESSTGAWAIASQVPIPAQGPAQVVGFVPTTSGLAALAETRGHGRQGPRVLVAWHSQAGPWRASPPFDVPAGAQLASFGPASGAGCSSCYQGPRSSSKSYRALDGDGMSCRRRRQALRPWPTAASRPRLWLSTKAPLPPGTWSREPGGAAKWCK